MKLPRKQMLKALHLKGWTNAKLDLAIGDLLPGSIRRGPYRESAYEYLIESLRGVPSFLDRFSDSALEEFYLKPAVSEQFYLVQSDIARNVISLAHKYPSVTRHREDLVQRVFECIYSMPDTSHYEPKKGGNFAGWFYWVCRNQTCQYLREQGEHHFIQLDAAHEPLAPDEYNMRSTLADRMEAAFGPSDALLFRQKFRDGISVRCLAAEYGSSEAAIYRRLKRLEDHLESFGYEYFAERE